MVFSFACLVKCKLAQLCLLLSSMNGIKHKKNTDTRKALAPKKCSGTRKVLTPEKCQHQSLHVPEDTAIHFTIVLDPPTAHLGPNSVWHRHWPLYEVIPGRRHPRRRGLQTS